MRLRVGEGPAALLGGMITGALAGLKADIATGGLTLGGGLIAGGLLGALGAAGLARCYNLVRGTEQSWLAWNAEALDQAVEAALLRYLAVAHFGRGRGDWTRRGAAGLERGRARRARAAARRARARLARARRRARGRATRGSAAAGARAGGARTAAAPVPDAGAAHADNRARMNIIILGAGRVGESVAENLVSEQNDITVIDTDPHRLRELQDRLDLRGVTGNGIHPSVLKAAGAADADMLIACAPLDETNLVACKLAHDLFNVPKTIARLRSAEFQDGGADPTREGFASTR